MRVIKGFDALLNGYESLPESGWLFIDEDFDIVSEEDIVAKNYYISESDSEEIDMEDSYSTFLESPTFKDVVINKTNHHPKATIGEIISAVIYYLENDDFLD